MTSERSRLRADSSPVGPRLDLQNDPCYSQSKRFGYQSSSFVAFHPSYALDDEPI